MIYRHIHKQSLHIVTVCLCMTVAILLFSSCFTGIESTPKIKLSREDRMEEVKHSAEDKLIAGITGSNAASWRKGDRFAILSDEAYRIFEQQVSPSAGNLLYFSRYTSRKSPSGENQIVLVFTDKDGRKYSHLTSRSSAEEIFSHKLPMLVDMAMVEALDSVLTGRNLWILTPLWNDAEGGNPQKGTKFTPVKIFGVYPGKESLPYMVRFTTDSGRVGSVYMTDSEGTGSSRPFHSLFSLTDPHNRYKKISDEVWKLITNGQIREGMTKEECRLSLGNPAETDSGHDYSNVHDLWIYPDGRWLRFSDGILVEYRK